MCIITRTDAKPCNNLLIVPVFICTLCIALYLTLNMGINNRRDKGILHVLLSFQLGVTVTYYFV